MAGSIHAVTMPKWGIEMTEGTISGWRMEVGAPILRGSEILDVETEKIVNAVEAPASGILRRILAGQGETRAVGTLLGVIAAAGVTEAEVTHFVQSFVGAVVSFEPESAGEPAPESAAKLLPAGGSGRPAAGQEPSGGSEEARVSPIARRVAERLGVDLAAVTGTGRNGRISKEDVEAFAARGSVTPPRDDPTNAPQSHRVKLSGRRATIARRLLESTQSIPHFRLDIDVDFGPLLLARQSHVSDGARVTVNDLLLRAVALALVEHPLVNAQLDGEEIVQFVNADIAIAVAADAGLVTPILRAANLKSIATIARESRELIRKARLGTLQREDIAGGSFTISNLGMYGVSRFDAIINAPQVAILAVGGIAPRAVVRSGSVQAAEMATLTLSADHRVVDGAVGAAFLATLRRFLGAPAAL